jgi:hypothetical protein
MKTGQMIDAENDLTMGVHHLLIKCSKSRVLLPPLMSTRQGDSSMLVVSFSDATFVFHDQQRDRLRHGFAP